MIDDFFASHSILTYIVAGEIALFFTTLVVTTFEKRWPVPYDFYRFFVWSFFVSLLTGYIDNNIGYAIAIGLAPELVYKLVLQLIPNLLPDLLELFSKVKKE